MTLRRNREADISFLVRDRVAEQAPPSFCKASAAFCSRLSMVDVGAKLHRKLLLSAPRPIAAIRTPIWRAYWMPRQSQPGDGTSSLPGGIRIPTENSNKLGPKDGEIPFLLSPRQLLPADQDKNENENRFCA